jgi:hypothetical protein
MAEAVSVQMFKAGDGSLHKTKEAADWRDRNDLKNDLTNSVVGVIEKDFESFAQSHVKKWENLNHYQQEMITEKIAELVVENFSKLLKIRGLRDFKP